MIKVVGICVLRDAVDLLPFLCGHYLGIGFDHLHFVDDGSSDGTFELLRETAQFTDQVSARRQDCSSFRQPELTTQAANEFIAAGYSVVIPFDADEFWHLQPDDLEEISALDFDTIFYGQWSNFVQSRSIQCSASEANEAIRYRAPQLDDVTRESIEQFRRPFVCWRERKVAVKTQHPVHFTRGQHSIRGGACDTWDRDFEIFHLSLRSRCEILKRAFNYEPRRSLVRAHSGESWQSAFHHGAASGGRLDEVWAANSADPAGHLDSYGEPLRLIPDHRLQDVLANARRNFLQICAARGSVSNFTASGERETRGRFQPGTESRQAQMKEADQVSSDRNSGKSLFDKRGFIGPVPLLTPDHCEFLMRHLKRSEEIRPAVWNKGRAVNDFVFYDLATTPEILGIIKRLLGEHVILWGASVQSRNPQQIHPWHSDIETAQPNVRSASVWIGIENTTRESALQVISGSHRFGHTVQEALVQHGLRRGEATSQMVEDWAKQIDRSARLVMPDMTDGEAIIFDGRLWHGTENMRPEGTRTALLLQFAAADEEIRIPDLGHLEWPFSFRPERPPVLLVSGTSAHSPSHDIVPPPSLSSSSPVPHILKVHTEALEGDPVTGWKPHSIFSGATCSLEHLTVHASVLNPGCCPHAPHAHPEEEILIVLDGEAHCTIPAGCEEHAPRVEVLHSSQFVYYPAYQFHTIHNASEKPITYLMMKWRGPLRSGESAWEPHIGRPGEVTPVVGETFAPRFIAEFPTSYLTKLHSHQSVLLPGGGYEPHADDHDVAIIVLSGSVQAQAQTFGPNSFLFHSAGALHGLRNAGDTIARYLVFEFHSSSAVCKERAVRMGMTERLQQQESSIEALSQEVRALRSSTSRRATAPLRMVSQFFAGIVTGIK
jgi:quercetin dioxygenase-like cupin family protein